MPIGVSERLKVDCYFFLKKMLQTMITTAANAAITIAILA